jgi:cytochrome c biogenesis protein CcmG, thiol:disulfide interchange protein DsbE
MQPLIRRIFSIIVLALSLGWIIISRAAPGSLTGGFIPAPQTGFLAPAFTLDTAGKEPIALADLRGRPVLLNFWASWCPPCRSEMPAIQIIYNDYLDVITVLAVNTTYQDTMSNALAFISEHNLAFPILLDVDGSVSRLYAISSLPTTFFIGADGIIQDIVIGGPMTEAGLRARIESLLEATP